MTDEEVFQQAIELTDSDRDEFLSNACNDREQRDRVGQLVSAHHRSDSLLDTEAQRPTADTISSVPTPKTIGDFEILRELGRGGMGVVYDARQKSLKRRVALKVLSSGLGLSSKAILRFRREAEAAGKLHHTNIVPIYTTGEDRGIHFYAMELIDGPSLDQVIDDLKNGREPNGLASRPTKANNSTGEAGVADRESGSSTLSSNAYFDQIATMIADVADALDHAHEQGVIHRDVKPSNLLLAPDGRLSINDFGLARMLEQPGMTMSGEFVGSPLYMSPEQITAGRIPLDHRTDIYSLGATLYELLTLESPFTGDSRDEVLTQIIHKEPKAPRKLKHKVPPDLETICLKSIEKDPDRRYQTAGGLASDLRNYVNRHAITARRIGAFEKTVRWMRKNPSVAALIMVVVAGVAGGWMALNTHLAVIEENRIADLNDAKQLVLLHSLGGDFDKAENELSRAQENGASQGWLKLMEGQIELFRGDYRHAQSLLRMASDELGPHIPAESLLAIAHLYSGEEIRYVDELLVMQDLIDRKRLLPVTAEDYFYLGFAYGYDRPKLALEYLNSSARKQPPRALHYVLRAHAAVTAANDAIDDAESLKYAELAVMDAKVAYEQLRGSPFALAMLIQAHAVAASYYHRLDESPKFDHHKSAGDVAVKEAGRFVDNAVLNFATYVQLWQTRRESAAIEFLLGLDQSQLNNYLRTYRLIAQIDHGDIRQLQTDFNAYTSEKDFNAPHRFLALLAQSPSNVEFRSIVDEFRSHLEARLAENSVDHIVFNWAVCKLLGLQESELECVIAMKAHARQYDGSFIGDTMKPPVAVTRGDDPDSIIASSQSSRRQLATAYFALGVDALSNGKRDPASRFFSQCIDEGYAYFYVCHISRAIRAKINDDRGWSVRQVQD